MQPLAGLTIGLLTSSASRLGGGVFEAVVAQAGMIRMQGGEARIFTLADAFSSEDSARFAPSLVEVCPVFGPAQVGYAPGLVPAMLTSKLDCLHQAGIWMYPTRAGAVWARRTGKPHIISPHGMLDPWITARGRLKKAIARIGYERSAWKRAAFLHALTGKEADDIRSESGRADSIVLPNPGPPASVPPEALREPSVVYIGRIHPKKNLTALVEAWKLLRPGGGAKLTIAGWGSDGDVAVLQRALANAPDSAEFIGPVYGEAKQRLLETARFTVLPTLSEGLPLSILESWAAGAPSIMTSEANLPEGFAANAAIECGYDARSIGDALMQALAMPEPQWLAMARAAHELAAGPFSAEALSVRWAEVYRRAIQTVAESRA